MLLMASGNSYRSLNLAGSGNGIKSWRLIFLAQLAEHGDPPPLELTIPLSERTRRSRKAWRLGARRRFPL